MSLSAVRITVYGSVIGCPLFGVLRSVKDEMRELSDHLGACLYRLTNPVAQ